TNARACGKPKHTRGFGSAFIPIRAGLRKIGFARQRMARMLPYFSTGLFNCLDREICTGVAEKGLRSGLSQSWTKVIEDRPGALGKLCRALADLEVNILAFQT